MKVKLYDPFNQETPAINRVLVNRGIKSSELQHYLNTTDDDINSPLSLGEDRLKAAATAVVSCIGANDNALIVVDSDCDGYTSSALLINYLYDTFPNWVSNHLSWFIHSGKQHGLSDCVDLASDFSLVICPDSSSNDYEEHEKLHSLGIPVVVLDHHEADKISENAIIINNQLSNYPNKDFSGVGIVWQFCRYLDSLLKKENANDYLDLVALGNLADMMSLKSLETKHLINKGFEPLNLKNPFIHGMAQKNSFKLGTRITPMGAAFYIAPFVNAMVRSGTEEEKNLLFKSMLKFEAFKEVDSTKRGHAFGEKETILDQALRTVTNVKNRQTKAQDKGMEHLESLIEEKHLLDDKVLLFLLNPGEIDKNIAGLIANKFMAKYQRPCCILTKVVDKDGAVSYQGSARGCDRTGVNNFKDICAETGCTLYEEGHQGAFGLGIRFFEPGAEEVQGEDILAFLEKTNEALKDISDEPIYWVDYIFEENNIDTDAIISIADHDYLWGKDVDEPFVYIKNLKITKDMIQLLKNTTIKISLPNNCSIIKFGTDEEEFNKLYSENGFVEINAVCQCRVNEWCGSRNPQLLLVDYEVVDSVAFIF